ncbi:hypothetical protein [Shewanella sp. OMA3-2]|uniref:hypothetical protein n=1 Tax=Shewanella sp. OMA3-2 TaxID=2908650 RepID=UPI001F40F4D4|nr:hypothetical protein [Shewanella sp. OMA3-2]UJF22825.1 hypothetical protein L0B17_05415 [Shewanella sp. OMA3-2]
MKVLDEAFIQLSNIKALPLPDLAIKAKDIKAETASANTEITDAESIDIADTDIATTEIINIAVANTSGADKQVTTVPEKDVTPSTTANNTLPVEPQLITQETTALIEQPKDIQAIETKVTDTKITNTKATVPQVTSIAPVELIADAKPPKPTAKVTAEKKQTVAEAQTNLALTQVNSNQAVSTLSAKPISTEPEITQLTLAARTLAKLNIEPEPNIGAELNIESADINTPTETAPNTPSNSASQVLRATLNADDAIDEVTQKLIAAQQAPSNIKAITQQVVSQIAQPKPNNTEAAALTVQATPVVPEQTVSQQTQPKQAASKADEVVRQTVTPAIAAPAINAPTINAPATAQVVASKQNSQTNYNGLNLKLQLNSIVDLTQLAKMSVSQFYNQKSRLPKPSDNIDLPINDLKAHPLINDIYLSEQSDVIVKLAKYYGDDSQLTFTPSITNDVGLINWKCHANIDPSLLVGPGESPCSLTQSAAAPASTTKL